MFGGQIKPWVALQGVAGIATRGMARYGRRVAWRRIAIAGQGRQVSARLGEARLTWQEGKPGRGVAFKAPYSLAR
jgi:hypothetical protein